MKFNNVVGNPPYNSSGKGRSPIYHLFTEKMSKEIKPEHMVWITQFNWITQLNPVGNIMREALLNLGVTRIEDNRFDAFEAATVRSCNIYCTKGSVADISLVDYATKDQLTITPDTFRNSKIPPVYNNDEYQLLVKLKNSADPLSGIWMTYGAGEGGIPYPTFAFGLSYFANFIEGAINKIKVIGPDTPTPGSYRVFKNFDNFSDRTTAEDCLKKFNGYWTSKTVRFILNRTLTSRTLDNPQISWIPVVPMDTEWDDNKIFEYFGLTEDDQNIINNFDKS
jgi:hypothetical protein